VTDDRAGAGRGARSRRRADQLAGGPHGIPREQVEANQSRRILVAMSELVAEHGYERTSVESVIARAGVSRKTFYDLRGGRDQWFVVVCEAAADGLLARLETAFAGAADRPRRVAEALVDFCRDDPAGARTCFVETLAANDQARAWRESLLDRLAERIAAAADQGSELAARAAIGAVLELAGRRPERLDRDYATALVTTMLTAGATGRAPR
jgi:AcrR family transcriptional regulator